MANKFTDNVIMKCQKLKSIDWFSIIAIFFMVTLVVASISIASFVYNEYHSAFGEATIPSAPSKKPVDKISAEQTTVQARAEWGQLGDYFGGALNPIFGFASLLALLLTIFYQARELNLSTKELRNSAKALSAQNRAIELQSFEQTFFSWLNTYRSALSSIIEEETSYDGILSTHSGRSLLFKWWREKLNYGTSFEKLKHSDEPNFPESVADELNKVIPTEKNIKSSLFKVADDFPQDITNFFLAQWGEVYKENEYQLDSLFRILYRLLIWIDSQHNNRLTQAQKWLYISLIRGQLSWIEMSYLYMNGLTKVGSKFKSIAEKYALFDNLTFESDISLQILKLYLPAPSGYSVEAYSSELAREKLGLPKSSEDTLAQATAVLDSTLQD